MATDVNRKLQKISFVCRRESSKSDFFLFLKIFFKASKWKKNFFCEVWHFIVPFKNDFIPSFTSFGIQSPPA